MTEKLVTVARMEYGDRKYIHATARRMVLARLGEAMLDHGTVRDLVDHLISECATRIATIKGVGDEHGRPAEIQGFAVEANDGTIEFLHLREIYADLPTTNLMGSGVLIALLGGPHDREVVLRRRASATTMVALRAGNVKAVIRPRSV